MDSKYFIVENDSWEKLEKDLDRCISTSNPCRYYSPLGLMCKDCEIIVSGLNMGCEGIVFKSIKERIRNLREETMTVKWYVKKSIYGDERKMAEAWCKFRNKCATDQDYTYRLYSVMKHCPKEVTKVLDSYLYMEKEV